MKRNTGSDRAVSLINKLTHTSGPFANQPFNLRPWQVRIVRELFKTRADGLRQYRTCLMMLPRKNGKTELAAAVAIYGLLFDGEQGGQIYSAAADRDQASLVFNVAAQMIRNDPELESECEIIDSQKRIVHRKSGSFYRAISAEAYSKHGFSANMIIYDELASAPNRELFDVLATSTGARNQPLTLCISTAGYDRHSILYELYAHAQRVKEDPALDQTFLPILYEMAPDADWTDIRSYKECNPALGDFRSVEELQTSIDRARQIPAQENTLRRLYGNQWTEQAERWMSMAAWKACEVPIDWRMYGRRPCYVGMDLSTTQDITALIALFPEDEGGFSVMTCCFVPKETIALRGQKDHRPYPEWERRGKLIATPGNVVDYDAVRAKLNEWAELYDVRMIGFDPWNATHLVNQLQQDGFECVPIRQGFASLNGPTKELTKAILSKKLRHDGHPVLADHIGNAAVETDAAGNTKLSKKASTERIDAASALCCAVELLSRMEKPEPKYEILIVGGGSRR